MKEIIESILKAPLPKFLVIVGVIFLFLGLGGEFTDILVTDNVKPVGMLVAGSIILLLGLVLWLKTKPNLHGSPLQEIELTVDSSQSGSIFVDLKTGERKRFGNSDTKHNRFCWVGRYNDYFCKGFICFEIDVDEQVHNAVGHLRAEFSAPDYEVRGDLSRLGPLILYSFDYGQYSEDMNVNVMDNGIKLHTMEDITDLKTGIDITNSIRRAIKEGNKTYKVALVYPGDHRGEELNAKILIDPQKAKICLDV